jgi:hypothetical protein
MKKSHAVLNPARARKSTEDFIDYDYVSKLSAEERDWLAQFTSEYYCADLKDAKLHTTKEAKRALFGANNARNRDCYTKLNRVPVAPDGMPNAEERDPTGEIEDRIIEIIDKETDNAKVRSK